jgi:hypothetical protein
MHGENKVKVIYGVILVNDLMYGLNHSLCGLAAQSLYVCMQQLLCVICAARERHVYVVVTFTCPPH